MKLLVSRRDKIAMNKEMEREQPQNCDTDRKQPGRQPAGQGARNLRGVRPSVCLPVCLFSRYKYPRELARSPHKDLHANVVTEAMFMRGTNWNPSKCPTFEGCLVELWHKQITECNAIAKSNSDFL